jgi:hypothetical protein
LKAGSGIKESEHMGIIPEIVIPAYLGVNNE